MGGRQNSAHDTKQTFFQMFLISWMGCPPCPMSTVLLRQKCGRHLYRCALTLTGAQSSQKLEAEFWNRNQSLPTGLQKLLWLLNVWQLLLFIFFFKCQPPWYKSNKYICTNYRKLQKSIQLKFKIILLSSYPESLNILIILLYILCLYAFFS